jgi:hypothetical protein
MKSLILTITFCICSLAWGSIIVLRLVPNNNYHAPVPETAAQQKIDAYDNCVGQNDSDANEADCLKLVGAK